MLNSMSKFKTLASTLPNFTPSLGYTYLPPSTNRAKVTDTQQSQTSRENTTTGDSFSDAKKATASSNVTYLEARQLEESLVRSLNYDDEYMDDYPVTGQPGDFHLATKSRVEKAKALPAVPAVSGPLSAPTGKSGAPTLPNLKTDLPAKKDGKNGKSPKTPATAGGLSKPKRRKSKALGALQPAS